MPQKKWFKHTEETKQKMHISAMWKNKWKTPWCKGKKMPPEFGKKISESNKWRISPMKGKNHTDEAKLKLSIINKWKKQSDETKRKISEAGKWRKFSEETKKKMSESHKWKNTRMKWRKAWNKWIPNYDMRWDKSPNWKWWVTPENKSIRNSMNFKLWRKSVFERDNFTCQKCWNHWSYLHPHHINNFSDFIELRFAIDNWITLCKICHLRFHNIYWRSNNTKEQLNEFLT